MTRKTIVGFVLATLFAIPGSAQPTFKFREITRTHDAAPVPAQLSRVSGVAFNNQSQVGFGGDGGLFFEDSGSTSLVAALGDHAPGGGTFLTITGHSMNSKGQIAFTAAVVSPTVFGGLYLASGGKLTQLVADGAVASSGDIVFPDSPAMNDAGTVAFLDLLSGGLFVDANGTINPVVRPGDPAPGGDTFIFLQFPSINNSGQIVFTAFLASGNQGVFVASAGTITKVAVTGDVFPHGGTFDFPLGVPSINDAGDVAFVALSNGSVLDEGVTVFSAGALNTVVPSFITIPSLGAAVFPESAFINNAGQIAFIAQDFSLSSTGLGVFLYSGGNVSRVISPGQSSPDGDVFVSAQGALVNDAGQVAFVSRLFQHVNALYVSANSQITRVAGQGDSVDRNPEFSFPATFGLSAQKQVLLFDETFPGGLGLSTAGPHRHDVSLDVHVSQTIGNDGVALDLPENFSMNQNGQAVMNSDLSHGISSILMSSPSGPTTQLVRASLNGGGDPTPSGGTLLGVRWSSINNVGQVTFSGFDTLDAGLYMVANGHLTMPVSDSMPIPGGPGTFGTISTNSINDHGDIAFLAQAFPVPNGMFLLSNGQFTSIARAGDPAPGGGTFDLGFPDGRLGPFVSNDGDVVFGDDLNTGSRSLFLFSKGTLTKLVGPGDPSPDGSTFFSADAPAINSSGEVTFAGVTGNGNGIFVIGGGVIGKVAVPGDKLHGETLIFTDLPQINDLGDIAFEADNLKGDTIVFVARPPQDPDQDADEVLLESGSGQTSQVPLKVMKARHSHTSSGEKDKD